MCLFMITVGLMALARNQQWATNPTGRAKLGSPQQATNGSDAQRRTAIFLVPTLGNMHGR
jgi:hypothetical protein